MFLGDIVKLAEQALEKPSDFGWWGREEMFESWGWSGISAHRDSNLIEISNFQYVTKDLMNRFPDDFEIVNIGHWAVGHVDQLTVRILRNPKGEIEEENITEAFEESMIWVDSLLSYSVACDEHYSDLVSQEVFDYAKQNIPSEIYIQEHVDVTVAEILAILEQEESYDYDNTVPTEDQMRMAAYKLRWCDYSEKDFWDEFAEGNGLPVILWSETFEDPSGAPNQIPGQMSIYDVIN